MSAKSKSTARVTSGSRAPAAMNSAFSAQSRRKQVKLKEALADKLRQDMARLLAEGTFADLTLVIGSERIAAHTRVLQARLAEFFSDVVQPRARGDGGEAPMEADLTPLGIAESQLRDLLRAAYTEDDVRPFWSVFQEDGKSHHDPAAPTDCASTEGDADRKSPGVEHRLEDQTDGQATEPPSVRAETNGGETGDQTAATALPFQACEYAALGDVKQETERRPPSAIPRSEVAGTDQTSAGKDSRNRDAAENGAPRNGAVSSDEEATRNSVSSKRADVSADQTQAPVQSEDVSGESGVDVCQLGQDLLQIFCHTSGHDVTLKVDGKEIPAHRFMLCARSQYFSAMLEGSWRESSSSVIELSGFSHMAVTLALQFIYGGAYQIPDGVVIRDVLYLADMYGLDMLKDIVELKLRMDYCHFFHKPCSVCLTRIPECLVLSSSIDMSDLDQCVLSWLVQYLDRAWSEKSFASLPQPLLFKCRDAAIQSLSSQSATALLLRLNKLACSLPRVKWTEAVRSVALHVQETCVEHMAKNLQSVIEERAFQRLLEGMHWNKDLMDSVFSRVVSCLTSDTACATFMAVHRLESALTGPDNVGRWNPEVVSMVQSLRSRCYGYLVSNASLLARAEDWSKLPADVVARVKKEAVFIDSRGKAPARRPVLSSSLKSKSKSAAYGSK